MMWDPKRGWMNNIWSEIRLGHSAPKTSMRPVIRWSFIDMSQRHAGENYCLLINRRCWGGCYYSCLHTSSLLTHLSELCLWPRSALPAARAPSLDTVNGCRRERRCAVCEWTLMGTVIFFSHCMLTSLVNVRNGSRVSCLSVGCGEIYWGCCAVSELMDWNWEVVLCAHRFNWYGIIILLSS